MSAAELREQVTELLGEPNEAVADALVVYATNKVAHVAGAALTARWRAEDELTEARAALDQLRAYARWCNDRSVEPETRDIIDLADGTCPEDYVALMTAAAPTAVTAVCKCPRGCACGHHSPSPAPSPVSAATEATGGNGEA